MPRFFDEAVLSDDQLEESEKCACGGVSPEALYNDYRNRMPFHYVEDDTNDGYYFWSYGATMELEVELEGEIAVANEIEVAENVYMPIVNFLKDSPTKYLRFDMQNFRGDVIDTQIIRVSDLTFAEDKVYAKYKITPELSAMMVPEQYRLFIYLIDESQGETGDSQDNKIIYNKCLTENGILIRVK